MFLSNANKSKTYYIFYVNPVTNKRTSRSCKTKLKKEAIKYLLDFKFETSNRPQVNNYP